MKNKNPLLVPELRKILNAGDLKTLQDFCESGHPAVIAELLSALASEEAGMVPWHADTTLRFEIYSHLDDNLQVEIIGGLNCQEIARLMSDMSHCDRADLFILLPENLQGIRAAGDSAGCGCVRRLCQNYRRLFRPSTHFLENKKVNNNRLLTLSYQEVFMKCPTCKDINLVMSERQGIEVDYCPECRGVWLDRGELDKIIERSAVQPSPPREREAYHDRSKSHGKGDYHYKKKKHKSLLGELFDF